MTEYGGSAHPYLHEPRIYITGLPAYVRDQDLALAFQFCAPFRPNIFRDGSANPLSGQIEFKRQDSGASGDHCLLTVSFYSHFLGCDENIQTAEKALATLNGRTIPELPAAVTLILSPYTPTSPPTALPPPNAQPRLVKHLPPGMTDSELYDLFRPYGALASVRAHSVFGPDTGVVEFWREDDARIAEEALHCADVRGSNIAVQVYQPRRAPSHHQPHPHVAAAAAVLVQQQQQQQQQQQEFNVAAPSFVPGGSVFGFVPSPPLGTPPPGPAPQHYSPSPPRGSPYMRGMSMFVHGPGQQVQAAAPGTSHSGLIDPCNLFCKVCSVHTRFVPRKKVLIRPVRISRISIQRSIRIPCFLIFAM
jgi:polyadenylate-binding protein